MKIPYFKFYADDWISSRTRLGLTYAQQGIYMLLLSHSWHKPLPPNKKMLAKLCPGAKASDIKEVIVRCFLVDESGLIQGRLADERQKSCDISNKASYAAKCMINKRTQEADAERTLNERSANQNQNQNQNQNIKDTSVPKRKPKKNHVVLPDWIDKTLWLEYERYRAEQNKGLNDTLRVAIIYSDLEPAKKAGLDPNEIILLSMKNGWTIGGAIKSLKTTDKKPSNFLPAPKGKYDHIDNIKPKGEGNE